MIKGLSAGAKLNIAKDSLLGCKLKQKWQNNSANLLISVFNLFDNAEC